MKKQMHRPVDFAKDPVKMLMVKLSIPSFFAIVMNLLYGFVDGVFIGDGVGGKALGGVSVVFPLVLAVIAFGSLIGEGLASVVSRSLASNEEKRVAKAIGTAHGAVALMSLVLVGIGAVYTDELLMLVGVTPDISRYARSYFFAMLPGMPFMALSLVYFHQLNAHGEMRIAMQAMMMSTVLNVILDYLAIYVMEMGVAGAGYATVASQVVWYGYMHVRALKARHVHTVVSSLTLKIDFKLLLEMMSIGLGSFVRQVGVSIAMMIINAMASEYGTSIYIIAFGAAQRIIRLLIAPIAAINIALKPVVGHNFGNRSPARIKEAMRFAFTSSLAVGVILLAVVILMGSDMGRLFGIRSDEMHVFIRVLLLTSCLLPFHGVQHLSASYFMSVGKAKEAVLINLLKQIIFLIPLLYVLPLFSVCTVSSSPFLQRMS